MVELAARVSSLLPNWTIRGATLACPGSLEEALHGLATPLVFPFFMAEGFFTGEVLPRRLKASSGVPHQLPTFGSDPALPILVSEAAMTGAGKAGLLPEKTILLLAAHGSQISPASRVATMGLARHVSASLPFCAVVAGFIEEQPYLADVAKGLSPALCLPLFTLNAGHVVKDVPEALAEAGFQGPVLPPIGQHAVVPRLIAAALERYALQEAA